MKKNRVNGGSIRHRKTIHPQGFSVMEMRRLVAYIQCHSTTGDTPISSMWSTNKWHHIRIAEIMTVVRDIVGAVVLSIGLTKADTSALSLW